MTSQGDVLYLMQCHLFGFPAVRTVGTRERSPHDVPSVFSFLKTDGDQMCSDRCNRGVDKTTIEDPQTHNAHPRIHSGYTRKFLRESPALGIGIS